MKRVQTKTVYEHAKTGRTRLPLTYEDDSARKMTEVPVVLGDGHISVRKLAEQRHFSDQCVKADHSQLTWSSPLLLLFGLIASMGIITAHVMIQKGKRTMARNLMKRTKKYASGPLSSPALMSGSRMTVPKNPKRPVGRTCGCLLWHKAC